MSVAAASRDYDIENEEARRRILEGLGQTDWGSITAAQPTETTTTPGVIQIPSLAPPAEDRPTPLAPIRATSADLLSSADQIQTATANQKQSALMASLTSAAPGLSDSYGASMAIAQPTTSADQITPGSPERIMGPVPLALPQDFERTSYAPVVPASGDSYGASMAIAQPTTPADQITPGSPERITGPVPLALPQDFERTSYAPVGTAPRAEAFKLPEDMQAYGMTAALAQPDVPRLPDILPRGVPEIGGEAYSTTAGYAMPQAPNVRRAELIRLPEDMTGYGQSLAAAGPVPRAEPVRDAKGNYVFPSGNPSQPAQKIAVTPGTPSQPAQTVAVAPQALPTGSAPPIQPALPAKAEPFQPDTSGSTRLNARYNNPGALGPTQSAIKYGGTPSGHTDTGHAFMQFPTREAGAAAQFSMWQNGKLYKGHTLAAAITNWVGPGETGEAEFIAKKLGIPLNTVITDEFLRGPNGIRLMQAQASYEGANVLTPEQWQRGQDWAYKGTKPGATAGGQPSATTTTATTTTATTTTAGAAPKSDLETRIDALIGQGNTVKMPKLEQIDPKDTMAVAQYMGLKQAKQFQDMGVYVGREELTKLVTSAYSTLQSQQVELQKEARQHEWEVESEKRKQALELQTEAAKRQIPQNLGAPEASQLADAQSGFGMVDNLFNLHQIADANGHGGSWGKAAVSRGVQPDAVQFETALEASITPVAKGVLGNTGNISESEEKNARKVMIDLGDSAPVAAQKRDLLKYQIANKTVNLINAYKGAGKDMSAYEPQLKQMTEYRDAYLKKMGLAPGTDTASKAVAHTTLADSKAGIDAKRKTLPMGQSTGTPTDQNRQVVTDTSTSKDLMSKGETAALVPSFPAVVYPRIASDQGSTTTSQQSKLSPSGRYILEHLQTKGAPNIRVAPPNTAQDISPELLQQLLNQ